MAVLRVAGIAYPVAVGGGAEALACVGRAAQGRAALVVTDANVAPTHVGPVVDALGAARSEVLVLEPGEGAKSPAGWMRVLDALAAGGFHRDDLVVALGGGVVGDLAGFAAACYQRGVDWMAVPTTLLAQVDAALGGKTAINHPRAKNLIGAFHDPIAVWIDPVRLETLPEREFRAGLAEVVKYGLGLDPGFFAWLEEHAAELLERSPAALAPVLERSARLKLAVVAEDRLEHGARALLNLGHTVGHALETSLGHGVWLHGEAVAAGLVAAAELSRARGRLEAPGIGRLRRLLERFRLPLCAPDNLDEVAFATALGLDKKTVGGRLRFVGLAALGRSEIWNDVTRDEIDAAVAAARAR